MDNPDGRTCYGFKSCSFSFDAYIEGSDAYAGASTAALSHIPWEGIRSTSGGRNVRLESDGRLVDAAADEANRVLCRRDCGHGNAED